MASLALDFLLRVARFSHFVQYLTCLRIEVVWLPTSSIQKTVIGEFSIFCKI